MEDLATAAQIRYIERLMAELHRGSKLKELDFDTMTKKEAGKLIGELLAEQKRQRAYVASNLPLVPEKIRKKLREEANG